MRTWHAEDKVSSDFIHFSVASFLDVMGAVLLTLLLFSFLSLSGSWRLFSLSSYTADKSGCVSADSSLRLSSTILD